MSISRWVDQKLWYIYTMEYLLSFWSCLVMSDSFLTPWTEALQDPCFLLLLELSQTHVHWVGDAIQPSHPLLSSDSSHDVAKALEFQFSISPSEVYQVWFPLGLAGLISLLSKGRSRVSSSTTVQNHQFFPSKPSLWSNFHIHK